MVRIRIRIMKIVGTWLGYRFRIRKKIHWGCRNIVALPLLAIDRDVHFLTLIGNGSVFLQTMSHHMCTEFKLWCFWSVECGFESPSAVTLVSLSKTFHHCFVLRMGR